MNPLIFIASVIDYGLTVGLTFIGLVLGIDIARQTEAKGKKFLEILALTGSYVALVSSSYCLKL